MKGAKGLLISITGGRDLTLFEVDEAATRIREEVDQDANIILGATFDEELEGVHSRLGWLPPASTSRRLRSPPRRSRSARHRRSRSAARPLPRRKAGRRRPSRQLRTACRSNPVAEAIQLAEANAAAMAQARPAPVAHADDFRPQSKIFQAPPAQPMPQPVASR